MSVLTEKSKSRFASRSKAQYSSQKDSRRENEEANAERRVLAKTRRRRTLENGNEVVSLTFSTMIDSGSAFLKRLAILSDSYSKQSRLFDVLKFSLFRKILDIEKKCITIKLLAILVFDCGLGGILYILSISGILHRLSA